MSSATALLLGACGTQSGRSLAQNQNPAVGSTASSSKPSQDQEKKDDSKKDETSPSDETVFLKAVSHERLNLITGIAADLDALKEANPKALQDKKVVKAFEQGELFVEEATALVASIDATQVNSVDEDIQETRLVAKTGAILSSVAVLVKNLDQAEPTSSLILSLVEKLEKLRKL
jgi:hypothetical protein